jgi:hypothetical protein
VNRKDTDRLQDVRKNPGNVDQDMTGQRGSRYESMGRSDRRWVSDEHAPG